MTHLLLRTPPLRRSPPKLQTERRYSVVAAVIGVGLAILILGAIAAVACVPG